MTKKFLLLGLLGLQMSINLFSQVTIGANKAPETFSILELVSNQKGGLRLPQMNTVQRNLLAVANNTLAEGLQIFNTDSKCVDTWDGIQWISQCNNAGGATVTANNGLVKTADNIQLGGTLIKSTEIAQNGNNFYTTGNGKVSVGAAPTTSSSKFEVNGASTNMQSFGTSGSSIDFAQSNLAYTTASPGAFTLTGLKDGGTYTLAVKGTASGTASFSQSGMTFRSVNNSTTTSGKQTLYTFVVIGADVYVWMTKGF
jgi:hypothetical protein